MGMVYKRFLKKTKIHYKIRRICTFFMMIVSLTFFFIRIIMELIKHFMINGEII